MSLDTTLNEKNETCTYTSKQELIIYYVYIHPIHATI